MILRDDDELYDIDQTYLGPPRRYIGVMRHRTVFTALVVTPVLLVIAHKMGMRTNLLGTGLILVGSLRLSQWIADHITPERTARDVASALWGDVTAPRHRPTTYTSQRRQHS